MPPHRLHQQAGHVTAAVTWGRSLRAIWANAEAEFHGQFVDFDPIWCWPKPVQADGPPVLLGVGATKWMPKRVLEYCTGWMPVDGIDDVVAGVAALRTEAERVGRSLAEFDLSIVAAYGAYGPFTQTVRIDFTGFSKTGKYFIKAGDAISPVFPIDKNVYKGAADFCLRYMRQQRSGFNPFLKDSCHTHDGYTLYGPMPDSTHIDVTGGWHDASDYLQYTTTSANAAYQLLAAYRDFPQVFGDTKQANGLEVANGVADVLDEARWGIDWLLKMNPKDGWLFNQLGDDRDHKGMRIPKEDTNY